MTMTDDELRVLASRNARNALENGRLDWVAQNGPETLTDIQTRHVRMALMAMYRLGRDGRLENEGGDDG